jgi:hypothetical protein
MMLVVKRRLAFLWVSTCSGRVVSVTSWQCAQSRCDVMAGKVGRGVCRITLPARVCNAFLVNAFVMLIKVRPELAQQPLGDRVAEDFFYTASSSFREDAHDK